MLNLRTQGLNNAAAVLGGYDAMVKAGLPVETGTPKVAPAPVANKVQPVPATASKSSQAASAPAAKTRPAKRRKVKTKH